MGDDLPSTSFPKKRLSKSPKGLFKRDVDADDEMGKPRSDQSPLGTKRRKERWLLTRKTWKYMADAGRRLIPEGVHNRPEDVPKIEKYFQEVCAAEPKFLLWRKSSYPGALGLRSHNRKTRTRKKAGSYREKASSADEADDIKKTVTNPCGGGLFLTPTSSGRFDIMKASEEKTRSEHELLSQLKTIFEHKGEPSKTLNHQELLDKLEKYLRDVQAESRIKHRCDVLPDIQQRELLDTLKRHYRKSTNRESVISNLLTDRKLLEKLYFDLRKARGFRGAGTAYLPEWRSGVKHAPAEEEEEEGAVNPQFLHPPLMEIVEHITKITKSSQTPTIHPDMKKAIEDKFKKPEEEVKQPAKDSAALRRRSSIDHDDVSPSVGDTIKRYLKMARKKSIDTDKADRFKMINYDKNLRNIKPKGGPMPGDDDGLNKGCQTDITWTEVLKTLPINDAWIEKDYQDVNLEYEEKVVSKPPSSIGSTESLLSPPGHSKGLLSSGQSFLSNLLQGLQLTEKNPVLPAAMQKSKSSTSVGRSLVSKKIWRGRSKSQSRVATPQTCSWTPQGNCSWTSITGRTVSLTDATILQLSEVERRLLQKVAVAKLQALNLGCNVRIPSEAVGPGTEPKPKRRAHLLKRKAITTSFFDTSRAKEKESATGGMVFGVSLSQCVENERVSRNAAFRARDTTFPDDSELGLRRKSHHGSRSSFSSLVEPRVLEESAGSSESLGGSVPGLLDSLSTSSMADITLSTSDPEPAVPNIVSACLRHIENYGLHILGIFRVSSSKKRVRQLREDFDSGKELTLGEDFCPHDIATLLKEYFRDLPEPLLCKDLYQPFLYTQKIRNRRLQYEALQHLIQLLPVANRDTLWSLLNFLSVVASNCDDRRDTLGETIPGNKMDSNNLATLFAPNILHSASTTQQDQLTSQASEERSDVINVVRTMIDHNKALFTVSAELLDEVYVHMMDSHPEALDQLLRKRDTSTDDAVEDPDSGALEEVGTGSESSSVATTPKPATETSIDERRAYSREQFLHANAGFDLYNLEPKPRYRRRERPSSSKKKWKEVEPRSSVSSIDQVHLYDSKHSEEEESKQSSLLSSSGVIKASLTIPTSSFALNLDDSDIPYIEDSQATITEGSKHQIAIGMMRKQLSSTFTTTRQRSISGSDSSQTSTPISLQPITGSLSLFQGREAFGYDSAVGSSATFSSPPRNTTTPSACSSSDRDFYSSPPSWASSPPLSPPLSPSSMSTMDCTPDDASNTSTLGRATTSKSPVDELSEETTSTTTTIKRTQVKSKDVTKVTFTKSEEKSSSAKSITKDLYQRVHSLVGGTPSLSETVSKSASSSHLMAKKAENEADTSEWSRRVTTSISNIGGAVMRSKTADIERMLKIKPETKKTSKPVKTEVKPPEKASKYVETEDKKKYAKRRYTESRHQTKTLIEPIESASSQTKVQSVWKRQELISSPLKDNDS